MFAGRIFQKFLNFPQRVLRPFGRYFHHLEAGGRSAEALVYLQILQRMWPEAIDELMPRVKLPSNALPDIASWYVRTRHVGNLQRQLNDITMAMAEGLVSLPLLTKIALFEEALRVPSKNSPDVFARYIRFLAKYSDSDERLTSVGDRFFSLGPSIWNERFKNAWWLYMAALVRIGRMDEALDILKRCDKKYRLRGIETVPPAAVIAGDNGYSSRAVDQAAELMRIVRENEKRGVLADFFSRKRVAIVGSSPLERGRGRGAEIDGHDIVIRFNNALAGKEFAPDFGRRTTILSRNFAPPWLPVSPEIDVLLIPDGLERVPLQWEMIKALLAASRQGKLVCGIPLKDYRSIMRAADIPHLSTGAVVCAYVKRLAPELSRRDLYGFSHLLDSAASHYGGYGQFHYFAKRCDEPGDMTFHEHPLVQEREFLLSLFPDEAAETRVSHPASEVSVAAPDISIGRAVEERVNCQVRRPWGSYTLLGQGPGFKVKRLEINPGASISLQRHHHRSEHWIVVSGSAEVTRDDEVFRMSPNESTYIKAGRRHRVTNRCQIDLVIIEVQSGDYLGEDDIVRYEDVYGRIS